MSVLTTMSGVLSLKRIAGIGKSILSWYEYWPLKPNPTTSRFPIRLRPWIQAFWSFCTCLSDENNNRLAILSKKCSGISLTLLKLLKHVNSAVILFTLSNQPSIFLNKSYQLQAGSFSEKRLHLSSRTNLASSKSQTICKIIMKL